jgi:ribokinase
MCANPTNSLSGARQQAWNEFSNWAIPQAGYLLRVTKYAARVTSTADNPLRFAIVGHVEWVEFIEVAHVPLAGEIVEAGESWSEAAGGGAVSAVQLAKLAGGAVFFTALGDDELGQRSRVQLREHGVHVEAVVRERPQRRAVTFLDGRGERTITTLGERLVPLGDDELPWERLAEMDGVYFTGGDAAALRSARSAKVLVATPRAREGLRDSNVELDALVRSAGDAGEQDDPKRLGFSARMIVTTHAAQGGTYVASGGEEGSFEAAPLPGPVVDAYGAGDSFAGGLTFGLGSGMGVDAALALAALCGAGNMTGRGPYSGQPTAAALGVSPR